MNKKNSTVSFISLTLIFSVFLLLPSFLFAQVYDNIGFKKDVPEEIRKACPMCDEFLDVKWIDEKRYIGKLKTEWYRDGEKQGILYYFVRLLDPGSQRVLGCTFYNIDEQKYHSKEFERLIKEADKFEYALVGGFIMYAKKGGKRIELGWAGLGPNTNIPIPNVDPFTKSFSNFSKTICVLYPNKDYVSIAETKIPFVKENLSKEEKKTYDQLIKFANNKCKEITGVDNKCYTDNTKYSSYAIDVNFDGFNDYIFSFNLLDFGKPGKKSPAIQYIYFSQGEKYKFKELRGCFSKEVFMPIFYVNVRKSEVFYILCNLTEIVQGGD
jgi:hypothetical protein